MKIIVTTYQRDDLRTFSPGATSIGYQSAGPFEVDREKAAEWNRIAEDFERMQDELRAIERPPEPPPPPEGPEDYVAREDAP